MFTGRVGILFHKYLVPCQRGMPGAGRGLNIASIDCLDEMASSRALILGLQLPLTFFFRAAADARRIQEPATS